ncbi:Alpha-D-kanosaminyltransferase [Phycisphaerae bacterium RAS1]|nr:Alpha-D-kanosaminyltransferase [Phycisphaerae bacterium RAS1]
MSPTSRRRLRVLYVAGPGDVVGTFRCWRRGEDDPSQVAITYSAQFFDVCRDMGAEALVISSHPRRDAVRDGPFTVENRPHGLRDARGLLFHLSRVLYGVGLVLSAVRFRADVVVGGQHGSHLFVFFLLRLFRIRFAPSLHCVLWPQFAAVKRSQRLLNRLDAFLFRRGCEAVLCVSKDIEAQVAQLAGGRCPPRVSFVPTYCADTFRDIPAPARDGPFRVLYAGRIEADKGVFGLLEIYRQLAAAGCEVEFDLCGDGSSLTELRTRARGLGVEGGFRCHGHLNRARMREMFAASGVVIVPTTSQFVEGFNKVVVESILAKRPVITSDVCPALSYVKEAVYVANVDDWASYRVRIEQAACRDDGYWRRVAACGQVSGAFVTAEWSFASTLRHVFGAVEKRVAVEERRLSMQSLDR